MDIMGAHPGSGTASIAVAAWRLWFVVLLLGFGPPTTLAAPYPFTLDFETGDLRGWESSGEAFRHQPTRGDNPTARNRGQPSNHQGNYWIGTYERYQGTPREQPGDIQGDDPTGTLYSAWIKIPEGHLSFLVGGGADPRTAVQLQVQNTRELYSTPLTASGRNNETMSRVRWDLTPYAGHQGRLVILDNASGPWGHINADDFRFEPAAVATPDRRITVPDVRNRRLIRAERLLQRAGLTARVAGRVPTASPAGTVIRQDPDPGVQVDSGTTVALTVSERIVLKASPSTFTPEVDQAVTFELQLTPAPSDRRKEFALRMEGEGGEPSWRFSTQPADRIARAFRRSGAVTVIPLARLGGEHIIEGQPLRLHVAEDWQPPRAGIGGAMERVPRGTVLELYSTSRFDPRNRNPRLSWESDGHQICTTEVCRIDSVRLTRGQHRVTLAVTDDHNLPDRTSIVYQVFETQHPVLSVEPAYASAVPGRSAIFTARWHPRPPTSPQYEWDVDGRMRGTGPRLTVPTAGLAPGSHPVRLTAIDRASGKQVAAAVLQITALGPRPEQPVPPWVAPVGGAALLILGLGLIRRLRRRSSRKQRRNRSVHAVVHPAAEIETRVEPVHPEGVDVRTRLAVDCRGEQTLEQDPSPDDKEPSP